jgi:DNA polymerase-1
MILGSGNQNATIMIVGDCFTPLEATSVEPFLGENGRALNAVLHEAKILRSQCYLTNVYNAVPPAGDMCYIIPKEKKHIHAEMVSWRGKQVHRRLLAEVIRLEREIELVRPNVIVAAGDEALWVLTGAVGVDKWRGSLLTLDGEPGKTKVIPIYHPSRVAWVADMKALTVQDLRRVAQESKTPELHEPKWNYLVEPFYHTVIEALNEILGRLNGNYELVWLTLDLETSVGHIACCGLATDPLNAICIPFMCQEYKNGYWSLLEEIEIVSLLHKVLTHPNVRVRGQNLLYDCQYIYRHWKFVPRVAQDTMITHHTIWAGLPKRLDFQASMYCEFYRYWKDDGKTWNTNISDAQWWRYNCMDCTYTHEIGEVTQAAVKKLGLGAVEAFQQAMFWPILKTMLTGVRIDKTRQSKLAIDLLDEIACRETYINTVAGHSLNIRSSQQMCKFFYDDLQIPPIKSPPKRGQVSRITCNSEALQKIKVIQPILTPLINKIDELRSLGVFHSTFVRAGLDLDGRMRCSYNPCGTETYRLSSSKSAFNTGTNLQNIPSGSEEEGGLQLPNIRKLFIPDSGFTFFDMDQDRADLQVVVWEANDAELKDALRRGVDMHLFNAINLAGGTSPDIDWLVKGHPEYDRILARYVRERRLAKAFIHGTNYGGKPVTMAKAAGITTHQADIFQRRYFARHPGIVAWHERTKAFLDTRKYVENQFGYRRFYFEDTGSAFTKALAWIPQSTVALVVNRIWMNFFNNLPEVMVLLQVHDSLAGQFPTIQRDYCLKRMKEEARIVIPYEDPLVIPVGLKTSLTSWGDCK